MSKDRDWGIFGNQGGSESEKYWQNKELSCGKVVGIVRICIVNARDSEPQKLPGLTGPRAQQAVFEAIVPIQNMWKGVGGYAMVLKTRL